MQDLEAWLKTINWSELAEKAKIRGSTDFPLTEAQIAMSLLIEKINQGIIALDLLAKGVPDYCNKITTEIPILNNDSIGDFEREIEEFNISIIGKLREVSEKVKAINCNITDNTAILNNQSE